MKLLKSLTLMLAATLVNSALGWNYTVHNNTPYHLITSFIRIAGLFDNPVVMTPNSTSNVSSWVGPIDYCYSGFHLLIQPLPGQQVPQVMFNGKAAAITAGKMPSPDALKQLFSNLGLGAEVGGIVGASLGAGIGAAAGGGAFLSADVATVGALTPLASVLMFGGAAEGSVIGGAVGTAIGALPSLVSNLKSITANEVTYTAPWIPIPGDACWNKTITLYYNASNNQIIVTIE